MKWLEVDPIPEECRDCKEEDCYNCDTAGKRRILSREEELRARRMLKIQAITRLQQQVDAINRELQAITGKAPE